MRLEDEKNDAPVVARLLSKNLGSTRENLGSTRLLEEEELDDEEDTAGDHL